jgi:purine-binding chemotaxis protein CheW
MKTPEEILQERANQISGKGYRSKSSVAEDLDLVEFMLTPEHYAVEWQYVSEVMFLKDLTPLPGVPAFVAGITNIRGRIVSVVNLKKFLGISSKGITELNKMIILKDATMEFGILTDSIMGTKSISTKQLVDKPLTVRSEITGFIKGITSEGLIVLDGEALLSAKSLLIDQKKR